MQEIYDKIKALRKVQGEIIHNPLSTLAEVEEAAAASTAYHNALMIINDERMKQLELRGVQALNTP